ncbi:MAG: hypothetical protein IKZ09_07485 [Clostridia bacterium]|nr:hypothetical protein [Clostridia bacterium]
MMQNIFKTIRKITIPPVFAALFLTLVYLSHRAYIGSIGHLLGAVFFLSVLPTLAYPMQKVLPKYKNRGREGQRSLAILFSFGGYLLGTLTAFAIETPFELRLLYVQYLLCGIGMFVLNKIFGIKASGHACGIVGPVIMCLYFGMYIPALIGAALILPVYISSVRTGQHTVPQLFGGSSIPAFVLFFSMSIGFLFH